MTFLKNLLFRHSQRINDFFTDAVKVYILKGEEDARRAALASAKVAGEKQRKLMIGNLSNMASKIMQSFPDKPARRSLSDLVMSLKKDIELENWDLREVSEEKGEISGPIGDYLSCLDQADPSVFRRKYPKLF